MTVTPELLQRSGELKAALFDFSQHRRFNRHLADAMRRYLPADVSADDLADDPRAAMLLMNAIDQFIFQYKLPDGRTLVELFVERHPELSDVERRLLLGWRDVVDGIFHVKRRDGDAVILVNLVDELEYRVHSNMGEDGLSKIPVGWYQVARVVPIEEDWLYSGASFPLPPDERNVAYKSAARLATDFPHRVFRNPETLERGWELQREERGHFVAFFGTDLIVGTGLEIAERMRAFVHYLLHEARGPDGKSAADRTLQMYGEAVVSQRFTVTPDMEDDAGLAVCYDEEEGFVFWIGFGEVEAVFANPDFAARGPHRRAVLEYLKDETIAPTALRRLAARDPDKASRVFAQVTNRPGFSWDRDGEALLHQYKAAYFDRPRLPDIIPLGDDLAQAARASRAAAELERAAASSTPRARPEAFWSQPLTDRGADRRQSRRTRR